jgi:hypothetical protein
VFPLETQLGDELCYILGCSNVIVLRRHQDDYYQLIGEGYLEGYNLGVPYSDLRDGAREDDNVLSFKIEKKNFAVMLETISTGVS